MSISIMRHHVEEWSRIKSLLGLDKIKKSVNLHDTEISEETKHSLILWKIVCHQRHLYDSRFGPSEALSSAWVGLNRAIEIYDPRYGVPFEKYLLRSARMQVHHDWFIQASRCSRKSLGQDIKIVFFSEFTKDNFNRYCDLFYAAEATCSDFNPKAQMEKLLLMLDPELRNIAKKYFFEQKPASLVASECNINIYTLNCIRLRKIREIWGLPRKVKRPSKSKDKPFQKCKICEKQEIVLRSGRCPACYSFWYRTKTERPYKKLDGRAIASKERKKPFSEIWNFAQSELGISRAIHENQSQ